MTEDELRTVLCPRIGKTTRQVFESYKGIFKPGFESLVFFLYFLLDFTERDIAELAQLPPTAVSQIVASVKRKVLIATNKGAN